MIWNTAILNFKKAILIIAFFSIPMFAVGQSGIVKGIVLDEFKSGLPGAEVQVIAEKQLIATTSLEGKYF